MTKKRFVSCVLGLLFLVGGLTSPFEGFAGSVPSPPCPGCGGHSGNPQPIFIFPPRQLMSSPKQGGLEYDGTNLWFTNDSGIRGTLFSGSAPNTFSNDFSFTGQVIMPDGSTWTNTGAMVKKNLSVLGWINNPSDGYFNVKAYGASGNGLTDDTTAIQAAINAAGSANGGIVWFPQGTYNISAQLNVPTNVRLDGIGYSQDVTTPTNPASVLEWTPSTAYSGQAMIYLEQNTANSGVENLGLRVNTAYVVNGITCDSVRQFRINNVSINNTYIALNLEANGSENTAQGHITNIFVGQTDYGIVLSGNTSSNLGPTDNYFSNIMLFFVNITGIDIIQLADSNYFYYVNMGQNGNSSSFNGVLLGGPGAVDVNREYFYGLSISGSSGYAISMTNSNADFYGVEMAGSFSDSNVYIDPTALMSHYSSNTGSLTPKTISGPTSGTIGYFEGFSQGGLHTVTLALDGYENDTTTSQQIPFNFIYNKNVSIISNTTGLSIGAGNISGNGITLPAPNNTTKFYGVIKISGY